MKKKLTEGISPDREKVRKIWMTMRLIVFLFFVSLVHVSASVYSQKTKLNIKLENATLQQAFNAIQEQSEFDFFYKNEQIPANARISVQYHDEAIEVVLNKILKGTGLTYHVMDKDIVISAGNLLNNNNNVNSQQQKSVSGKVTDTSGATLPGVSVVVKGTTTGVTSDMEGKYSLSNIPTNSILQFSFVGMKSQEIVVAGKTTINVTLVEESIGIEEVVAVGYGTQKKVNLTGAVGVVNSKTIENRPVANTFQALQGIMPGLNLTVNGNSSELGGTYNINVRGYTSINGGGPLVLIDGVRSSLEMLNPADIENVTVLKDQASAAIYGAQAAYGVLMITTKKGTAGKTSIEYSNNFANRSPLVLPKNMNSLEFATMFNRATTNDNVANVFSEDDIDRINTYLADPVNTPVAIPTPNKPNVWGKHNYSNANTDWYPTIYKQNVFDQQHNLNVRGGSEDIQYYISGSFLQQDGLLRYGDQALNKYTINGKLDGKINSWLRVNFDTKYAIQKINRPSFGTSSLYSDLSLRWPNNYIKDPNGFYSNFSEILKLTDGGRHNDELGIYTTTAGLIIEPFKDWTTNISVTKTNTYGEYDDTQIPVWEHGVDLTPVNVQGITSYQSQKTNNSYSTISAYTTYEKKLKDSHSIKGMIGWQYEYNKNTMVNGKRQNLVVNSITSLSAASGDQFVLDDQFQWANNSIFSRINYNYKEKYLLEINARSDGSSRFPQNNRWGIFPSISAGYILSQESYWEGLKGVVDFFKLRVSYGELGNQSVSTGSNNEKFYTYIPTMPINLSSSWIFPDNSRTYVSAPGLVSQNLTWETVKGWNVGFTGNTINNRLSVDFELYKRITDNMFGPVASLPAILGTSAPKSNNATLETKGYEISLGWKDRIGKLNYNITASLADYTGKILEYNNPTMLNSTYYKGSSLGEIWGYVSDGLFQTAEEISTAADQTKISSQAWKPGDVKYKDLNGDKKIDWGDNTVMNPGDRTIIGNTTPRYNYSFNLSCSWQNFDFNMFWQGIGKRDLWISNSLFWGVTKSQFSSGGFKPQLDYWTEDNIDAYFPRPLMNTFSKNQQVQSRYLLNASYLRLKSLQIGYTIPLRMANKILFQKCRVYIAGENLITFTNMFKNFDPEVENNGLSYPLQSALSIGCNISF